ncbi:MAG: hypothetical protein AAF902_22045 [Chloroflexota bacterium]
MQRITTLTSYLLYRLFSSMASIILLLVGFAYYWLTFYQRAPEPEYFVIVIGAFGLVISFFSTLAVASLSNEAKSYPFFMRLQSRTEFLASILLTALIFALLLQLLMTAVVLIRNGPELTIGRAIEVPPIWLSLNILASVLALQASDFVSYGWSRVWIFGLLAVAIIFGDNEGETINWIASFLRDTGEQAIGTSEAIIQMSEFLIRAADFLTGTTMTTISNVFGSLFWPFRAILDAVQTGYFTRAQAFAPALILLFAAVLFLLAADFFNSRDMTLAED